MAGQVRTETEQMSSAGRQAQEIAGTIRTLAQSIDQAVAGLRGRGWVGEAGNAAQRVILQQQERAQRLVAVLDGHGDATVRGSNAIAGQEAAAASSISAVGAGAGTGGIANQINA